MTTQSDIAMDKFIAIEIDEMDIENLEDLQKRIEERISFFIKKETLKKEEYETCWQTDDHYTGTEIE